MSKRQQSEQRGDRRQQVRITVDDNYLERVSQVVGHLRAAGLSVTAVMEKLGAITGSVEPANVPALSKVKGVSAVERAQEYRIAPPSSKVQ